MSAWSEPRILTENKERELTTTTAASAAERQGHSSWPNPGVLLAHQMSVVKRAANFIQNFFNLLLPLNNNTIYNDVSEGDARLGEEEEKNAGKPPKQ